jgi:hypothetical protein
MINKENFKEEVTYYLEHLQDDGFKLEIKEDYFRIYKDRTGTYKYSDLIEFEPLSIWDEINRFLQSTDVELEYSYLIKRLETKTVKRELFNYTDDYQPGRERILAYCFGFKF